MEKAMNDNDAPRLDSPSPAPVARVIGYVGAGQRVTITDPSWRPTPQPARHLHLVECEDGQPQP
jgi:hypothetical protein